MRRIGMRSAACAVFAYAILGGVSLATAQTAPAAPSTPPASSVPPQSATAPRTPVATSAPAASPAAESAATPGAPAPTGTTVTNSEGVPALDASAASAGTEAATEANAEVAPAEPKDTAALMAQLDAEMGGAALADANSPSRLTLYGFTDIGFYKFFIRKGSPLGAILYPKSTFTVGNLNLYLAGELGDGWRSLAEVRFSYLPNGSRTVDASGVHRADTLVSDYTNMGRVRRTGSIMIERAWLEYAVNSKLTLRGGSWLTPYGVWNEDHGSPTIIPVSRPYVIGLELLPERQTGVLAFGNFFASDSVTLGYAVGVSNGRSPIGDFGDLDENKALTFRLNGTYRGTGVLSFGASSYVGRYTDVQQSISLDGGVTRIDETVTHQYDEVTFGLDARYTLGGFHAQSEFLVNDELYTEEGRPIRIGNVFQPDNRRYGAYAVVGYRFDWFGLMPFATAEYFSLINVVEPTRPPSTDVLMDFAVGLNARPTDNVTLKLEGNLGVFYVDDPEGSAFEHPVPAVQAQAAWAF